MDNYREAIIDHITELVNSMGKAAFQLGDFIGILNISQEGFDKLCEDAVNNKICNKMVLDSNKTIATIYGDAMDRENISNGFQDSLIKTVRAMGSEIPTIHFSNINTSILIMRKNGFRESIDITEPNSLDKLDKFILSS